MAMWARGVQAACGEFSAYKRTRDSSTMIDVAPTDSARDDADNCCEGFLDLHLSNSWQGQPLVWTVVVYSVIIPAICLCGILGNIATLLVLQRRPLKESTYTYLTVLAAADLITCVLMLFSGLARGIFWKQHGWLEYDVFVYIPVGSITSNVAVLAASGVAIDRLVIVVGPVRCRQPKFCSKTVARTIMSICVCVTVLFNLPFFFIYTYDDHGIIVTKNLSDTWIFTLLNWMQLVLFGLLPALFLLICNVIMIFAIRRILEQRELFSRCRQTREGKYLRNQFKLTITLVGIVFLFLIGEIPTHLASRRSAISILYGGDPRKIDKSVIEIFRLVATVLSAISSSANFVMYCLLNPKFLMNLKAFLKKEHKPKNTLMRVATIKGTMQSEITTSHVDYPWKF